jgi:hypothetical protein
MSDEDQISPVQLLSVGIGPELLTSLVIQLHPQQLLPVGEVGTGLRVVVVGIGAIGASEANLLATRLRGASCYGVMLGEGGSPTNEIVALCDAVRNSDFVILVSGFEDNTTKHLVGWVVQTAGESGLFTLIFSPELDNGYVFPDWGQASVAVCQIAEASIDVDYAVSGYSRSNAPKIERVVRMTLIRELVQLVVQQGIIGIDYADVKQILASGAIVRAGTGIATDTGCGGEAARLAFEMLERQGVYLATARGFLVFVTASSLMSMADFDKTNGTIEATIENNCDADFIVGIIFDETMGNTIKVTVLSVSGLVSEIFTTAALGKSCGKQAKTFLKKMGNFNELQTSTLGTANIAFTFPH